MLGGKYSMYSKEQIINDDYKELSEYLLSEAHDLEIKRKMQRNFI